MQYDVRFTDFAKKLMAELGLTDDDKTLVAAIINSDPFGGKAVVDAVPALRVIEYVALETDEKIDVFFICLLGSDLQLQHSDLVLVISFARHEKSHGIWLEPERLARIIELVAEMTRYVIG